MIVELLAAAALAVVARDDGRWAQADPEIKKWIEGLKNRHGKSCCNSADGYDVKWETSGGKYRIEVAGSMWDVPDEAVLAVPNRIGVARAWYSISWGPWRPDGQRPVSVTIHCFLPGAGI